MQTTLNKIRNFQPCQDGWKKLLAYLNKTKPDDEPLALTTILESNGLDDALWCLCAVDGHDREIRLYAVWCARQVQHLMTDPRSLVALDIAEQYANGEATQAKLAAAEDAAWAAADGAAGTARAAAWTAAWAAADGDAAWAATEAATEAATMAAGAATEAATMAAAMATRGAACDQAKNAQAAQLQFICSQV